MGRNDHLDLEENRVTQVWFEEETDHLEIEVAMQVKTLRSNAYDFLLTPEAAVLPIGHEHDTICARAYLERIEPDDSVTEFAAELSLAVNRDTLSFLDRLNHQLFAEFTQMHRHTGAPQSQALTLQNRCGACRDLWPCCSSIAVGLRELPHASAAATRRATSKVSGVTCMPGRKCICPAPAGAVSITPTMR